MLQPELSANGRLYLQFANRAQRVVALGEVLWDVYDHSHRLGGAPLNFGAHVRRLGHCVTFISALGADELGERAGQMIRALDLDTSLLQTTPRFPTGTARVRTALGGAAEFTIERPAAYDDVELSERDLQSLQNGAPGWLYYGTVFASAAQGRNILGRVLEALTGAVRFYDLNLRPGSDSPMLVKDLLAQAGVVKLNEDELRRVHEITGLPAEVEAFCREGAARYGWRAVAVTLGDRGCAILANGQYVEAGGHPVDVVDTVGAGDAFSAAFLHGLSMNWPAAKLASFANRVGALVVSRHGAIPDWTPQELAEEEAAER